MNCQGPCGKPFQGTSGITISRRGWCSTCEFNYVDPTQPVTDWDALLKNVDAVVASCKFPFEAPPDSVYSQRLFGCSHCAMLNAGEKHKEGCCLAGQPARGPHVHSSAESLA